MTRGKKLGILCGVLAVAIIGCIAAKQIAEHAEDADTTSVMNIAAESITGLQWTYDGETISIVRSGEEWSYETPENEEDMVDTADAEEMVQAVADLRATAVLTPEEQEGDYGFDSPTCEIIVKTDTADTTYTIGSLNEITNQYYLQITGSENVFTIDTSFIDMFEKDYDAIKATPVPTASPSPSPSPSASAEASAEAETSDSSETVSPSPETTPEEE